MFFTEEERERAQSRVLEVAALDARIVSGAVVGALALTDGDRWSDLDLTFAVADEVPLTDVFEDWTGKLAEEFEAIQLFDLPSGTSIYRVFLLPGCMQFDLSFTPASSFGATNPKFKLLFGTAVEKSQIASPPAREPFGYAVHHALRAYLSRAGPLLAGRVLAQRRPGLCAGPRLPESWPSPVPWSRVRRSARGSARRIPRGFPASLRSADLRRALGSVIDGLLRESSELGEVAAKIAPRLRSLR